MVSRAFPAVHLPEAIAQNGPLIDEDDASATANAATLTATPFAYPATSNATAPENAHSAICQRRSFVRSECVPTSTITVAATKYGTADKNPSSMFGKPLRLFNSLSSHKPTP